MEVTDIRMRLINDRTDRLKAFCTVTFDEEFVVRDVKVVEGPDGFFIAMPSRKLSAACPACRHKNQVRARFCEECGGKLRPQSLPRDPGARTRLYRDIAHPITPAFREKLQTCIIDAYRAECENLPEEEEFESEVDVDETTYAADDADTTSAQDDADTTSAEDDADTTGAEDDADTTSARDDAFRTAEEDPYDVLIADLKNGTEPAGREEPESSQVAGRREQSQPRDGEPGSGDKRRRGRRRGRRGDHSGQPRVAAPEREAQPVEDSQAGQSFESEEPVMDAPPNQPEPEKILSAVPADPEPETADRVSLDEATTERPDSDDASGDSDTPFGAGIL